MVLGARDVLSLIRLCKPTTVSVILHKSRSNPFGTYMYLDRTKALHRSGGSYVPPQARKRLISRQWVPVCVYTENNFLYTPINVYICLCLVFSPPPLPAPLCTSNVLCIILVKMFYLSFFSVCALPTHKVINCSTNQS